MPEIHEFARHAVYVARKGEVNAWDNEDFVRTVRATGRKTLIMAGVWTSVCVMFPALDAKVAGYKVYAVMDASGDVSEMANRTTLARLVQGGVIPTTTNAVLSEVHRTWNRPEAAEIGKLYAHVSPNYAAVVESYLKAQEVAKQCGSFRGRRRHLGRDDNSSNCHPLPVGRLSPDNRKQPPISLLPPAKEPRQ